MLPDLMALRVAAHYLHDPQGRILQLNQWDGGRAPRWYLGRSPATNVWRCRADVTDAMAAELNRLALTEPRQASADCEPVHASEYQRCLAPVSQVWSGPCFWFPPVLKVVPKAPLERISAANAATLTSGLADWLADVPHRQPFLAVVVEGRAVAVCASVRISEAVHEAGVETLPEFRRRGFAAAVVSAWAAGVRAMGAQPIYSTSWNNHASRGVAAALGLELIGVDYHLT